MGRAWILCNANLKTHAHFPQGIQGLGLIVNSGISVKLNAFLNVSIYEVLQFNIQN